MSNKNLDKPVTNRDLIEVVKALTSGIEKMFENQDKRFDKLEDKIEEMNLEVQDVKKEVRLIRGELVEKVDRTEFNRVKIKVDRYVTS